jgi:3-hydroxymyristoyl/3-hydroxydecanoyl-(acyl carrier protein) dehydratase
VTLPPARTDFDLTPMYPLPTGDEWRVFAVRVPADLLYFRGHFDDFQVLPAVVQLHTLVLGAVARAWPSLHPSVGRITQLKFRRPIRPEEVLVLTLRHPEGSHQVSYTLTSGARICSQGTLEFADLP